ncbi:MAG TPA: hypothetical protein VHI13_18750 [Candidatus Kapabacteria bacterium]|nr:hypothetical protein [Candidatus Kapabacteria bacterium]
MMAEGRYAVDIPVNGLAAGSYLVELRSGEKRNLARLIVVR